MKWGKIFIALTIVVLIFGISLFVFSVRARMTGMEYQFQVDAVLSAAGIANNGEMLTDPEKAVIAEYEGRKTVIAPGNYTALSSYLRKDAAMPLWIHIDESEALKITVCNEAVFLAAPEDEKGDVVLIRLTTGDQTFSMRTDGGNQWSNLLKCCMEGTHHDQNQPFDAAI